MIFVDVMNAGTEIRVSGDTYPIRNRLGINGIGLKFNKRSNSWEGPASLKNLMLLKKQSGVTLTAEAEEAIRDFEIAARKRRAYIEQRGENVGVCVD
jgi:hypothetical protein